jgi:hypothetical protein
MRRSKNGAWARSTKSSYSFQFERGIGSNASPYLQTWRKSAEFESTTASHHLSHFIASLTSAHRTSMTSSAIGLENYMHALRLARPAAADLAAAVAAATTFHRHQQ